MSTFVRYPSTGGIPTYADFASLPSSASDGSVALTLDNDDLYAYNVGMAAWVLIGGPGAALSLGNLDSETASAKGAGLTGGILAMQSASATLPGLVNNTTQSLSGNKTFTGSISASNLSGTNTGDVTLGTANGLSIPGQVLSLALSSTSTTGALSSTDWNTFNGKQATITIGAFDAQSATATGLALVSNVLSTQSADATHPGMVNITTQTFAGNKTFTGSIGASNLSGTNTGDVTLGTANGLSIPGQVLSLALSSTSTTGALSSTDWNTFNGKQAAGNYITALTGDATASGPGSAALTLATVNGNVGTFGSSTSIPTFTVNGKGLVTAASGNVVIAPAGTLSGTTLNATVVTSSLTSVGTITSGTWTGTTIAIANGGTGQTVKANAFDALSPMTTSGDIIYGGTSGTGTRLAKGSDGQVLTLASGIPSWAASTGASGFLGTVSSAKVPGASGRYLAMTGNSITLLANTKYALFGTVLFNNSGSTSFTDAEVLWCAANGADNGSTPANISTVVTVDAPGSSSNTTVFSPVVAISTTAFFNVDAMSIRVAVAGSNQTVYLVPFVSATIATNASITCFVYAQVVS